MLIGVGIPNNNDGHNDMMKTLALISHEIGTMGHKIFYAGFVSACIDGSRNDIYYQAQEQNCDYLIMMDTDGGAGNSSNILKNMMALNKDVVSGVVHKGAFPYEPCVFQNWTEDGYVTHFVDIPDEPFEISACGGAFMLINKKVLQAFSKDLSPGDRPFDIIYKPSFLREDIAFCKRLKEKGFEIWADPRPDFSHWKEVGYNKRHFDCAKKKILGANKEE